MKNCPIEFQRGRAPSTWGHTNYEGRHQPKVRSQWLISGQGAPDRLLRLPPLQGQQVDQLVDEIQGRLVPDSISGFMA